MPLHFKVMGFLVSRPLKGILERLYGGYWEKGKKENLGKI